MTSAPPPDDPRLSAARDAVLAAARVTRAVQADLARAGVLEKDDSSPVTVADYTAQAIVVHVLEAQLGPVRLVGEERADALREADNAALLERCVRRAKPEWSDVTAEALMTAIDRGAQDPSPEGFWTLDPVDGTKGFLRNQQYAVSLAWIEGGRPTLGVLGCPNIPLDPRAEVSDAGEGVFALATLGGGAWQSALQASAPLERLAAASAAGPKVRVCESVEKRHSNFDANAAILAEAGLEATSVRLDSQAKYLVVARDQADVYLRLPSQKGYVEKIWDHAAGALVATEAGLVVTDLAGRSLDFGHGRRLENNRGVVVAPAEVHARLVAAARKLGFT